MAISGITFDNLGPTAADHGVLFSEFGDGIVKGCGISYVGTTVTIAAGYLNICGRLMKLAAAETVTLTGTSGYARVIVQIDTTNTIPVTISGQTVYAVQPTFEADYSETLAGFSALTTDDINASGTMYQVEFAIFTLESTGITSTVRSMAKSSLGVQFGGTGATTAAAAREALSAASLTNGKVTPSEASAAVVGISESVTLSSDHVGKMLLCINTSDITITVPSGLDSASEIEIVRSGTGGVTLTPVAGSSAILGVGISGSCEISDQYGACALKQIGTGVWLITGNIEAVS